MKLAKNIYKNLFLSKTFVVLCNYFYLGFTPRLNSQYEAWSYKKKHKKIKTYRKSV